MNLVMPTGKNVKDFNGSLMLNDTGAFIFESMTEFEVQNCSLAQHLFSGEALIESDREMLEYPMFSGVYDTTGHRVENKVHRNG